MLTEFAMIAATAGLQEAAKKAVNGLLEFYKKNDYYFEDGETESVLKEYMENAYQRNAIMNTIAFRGEGRTIFDLYYPLRIYRHSDYSDSSSIGYTKGMTSFISSYFLNFTDVHSFIYSINDKNHSQSENELKIVEVICRSPYGIEETVKLIDEKVQNTDYTQFLTDIIDKNVFWIDESFIHRIDQLDNIMIIDNAGMGKSTIARYISISAISNKKYIPIIIELRKLRGNHSIWDELFSQLDMYDQHLEIKSIKEQLRKGGFLVIFDGFDEVTDDNKTQVIAWIKDFVSKAKKNKYILTSRQEKSLNAFGEFTEYAIAPLKENDAFSMILKFGNNNNCAKQLIQYIEQDKKETPTFREFLCNPLMVSLLYRTFQYKNDLPRNKNEFYAQVYDALFCDHDKTKDGFVRPKKSDLSKGDFENVLRWLGWLSFQNEQLEFEYDALLDIVEEAIENTDRVSCSAEDFVHDITHSVPLFEYVGSSIKWCHKSFMEYFSARCLYKDASDSEKKEILTELFSSKDSIDTNYNLISFYIGMDYKSCRDYIYIPFLKEMIHVVESSEYWNDFYIYFSKEKVVERNAMKFAFSLMLNVMTTWTGKRAISDIIHSNIKGFYSLTYAGLNLHSQEIVSLLNDNAFTLSRRHNPLLESGEKGHFGSGRKGQI